MEEDRAIRLFVSGKIAEAQLDIQRKFITERLENARAKLDDYRAREASGVEKRQLMETILAWARNVGQGLDKLTPEQRKEILQMVLEQVVIDKDKQRGHHAGYTHSTMSLLTLSLSPCQLRPKNLRVTVQAGIIDQLLY